jgi:hypothetical protein
MGGLRFGAMDSGEDDEPGPSPWTTAASMHSGRSRTKQSEGLSIRAADLSAHILPRPVCQAEAQAYIVAEVEPEKT